MQLATVCAGDCPVLSFNYPDVDCACSTLTLKWKMAPVPGKNKSQPRVQISYAFIATHGLVASVGNAGNHGAVVELLPQKSSNVSSAQTHSCQSYQNGYRYKCRSFDNS